MVGSRRQQICEYIPNQISANPERTQLITTAQQGRACGKGNAQGLGAELIAFAVGAVGGIGRPQGVDPSRLRHAFDAETRLIAVFTSYGFCLLRSFCNSMCNLDPRALWGIAASYKT